MRRSRALRQFSRGRPEQFGGGNRAREAAVFRSVVDDRLKKRGIEHGSVGRALHPRDDLRRDLGVLEENRRGLFVMRVGPFGSLLHDRDEFRRDVRMRGEPRIAGEPARREEALGDVIVDRRDRGDFVAGRGDERFDQNAGVDAMFFERRQHLGFGEFDEFDRGGIAAARLDPLLRSVVRDVGETRDGDRLPGKIGAGTDRRAFEADQTRGRGGREIESGRCEKLHHDAARTSGDGRTDDRVADVGGAR